MDSKTHKDTAPCNPLSSFVTRLGLNTIDGTIGFASTLAFLGETTITFLSLFIGKSKLRLRNFFLILQETGPRALPIVFLISFLVGIIITFLGAVVLQRMGAEVYVSYILGFGVLREMGVLMVAIIMAGRTGAAFAASLGSMKVSEEIDALTTFGISPIEYLVIPRILALIVMMPFLTIIADFVGIVGGYMISAILFDMSPAQFFGGMKEVTGLTDLWVGVGKSVIFGAIIGFCGCLRGMQCKNSADAVGLAATSAVVTSITLIVVANALVDWISIIYNI
ncbi:ABC transporter permease [PVC group bacterium]|nr:ABC transporter permease [PVC group bacterium]